MFVACGPREASTFILDDTNRDTPGGGGDGDAGTAPNTGASTTSGSADPGTVITEPNDEAAPVFAQDALHTYELTIAPDDLAAIDAAPADEVYVPARFSFDGEQLDVGVRYKGSVGAFGPPCTDGGVLSTDGAKAGKCSVKVSFHWAVSGQRFRGLKKLNFHSLNSDESLMRDRLGYSLFREFGLPAPRSVHARLIVNGELEGLFAVVEQVDGRFTRSRFTEGGLGNLYKEIWPYHADEAAYLAALETNEDEDPSVDKMLRFTEDIGRGVEGMEAWLDVEQTIKYVAADRIIINDDGIFHWWCPQGGQGNNPGTFGNHNYYWYEAENAARFWLIAWDFDHSFTDNALLRVDPEWRQSGSCSCLLRLQSPASCDPMIALWGTHWSDRYENAVDEFLAGPFAANDIEAKLSAWEAQIAPAVAEAEGINASVSVDDWQGALDTLRAIIVASRRDRGAAY